MKPLSYQWSLQATKPTQRKLQLSSHQCELSSWLFFDIRTWTGEKKNTPRPPKANGFFGWWKISWFELLNYKWVSTFNITQILFSKLENVPAEKQIITIPWNGIEAAKSTKTFPPPPKKNKKAHKSKPPKVYKKNLETVRFIAPFITFCVVWCLDIGRSTGGTWCFYGDVQFPKSGEADWNREVEGDGSHPAIDLYPLEV